jgi:uridine kinase
LLDEIAAGILGSGEGRLRVGIDRPTAAGKTSLGHELAREISLAGRPVLRASLDDFKKPRTAVRRRGGSHSVSRHRDRQLHV